MQFKDIGKLFTKNLLITELLLVWLIIVLGAFTFHFIEWWRIIDSFYFIISTMSTVWFWDFTPKTDIGKYFFMFYALIGVPFFVSIGGLFLETRFKKTIEHYLKRVYKELREAEEEIQIVEETVLRRFKKPLEDERKEKEIENLAKNNIAETPIIEKQSRWKKIFKR